MPDRFEAADDAVQRAPAASAPTGETLGAVPVMQDITERKHAELELERVHKQLMSASRQAGMAEVATNVLHNVGNILNSINISASLRRRARQAVQGAGAVAASHRCSRSRATGPSAVHLGR